ncbi:unnamed protein product, partial [Rotaria sp. Silwood1]
MSEIDFVRNVSLIIDQESPRTLQNYIIWRFIMSQIDNMPNRFRSIKQEFNKIFREITTERPRTITCATYVNNNMGFAVSKLYINKYIDKDARNQVRTIDEKIGYPDYLASNNVTKLENDYTEYKFDSSYVRNTLIIDQLNAKNNFRLLRKQVDRKTWSDYAPTTVNAFYFALYNDITFPAGFLQPPFFHKDVPKVLGSTSNFIEFDRAFGCKSGQ